MHLSKRETCVINHRDLSYWVDCKELGSLELALADLSDNYFMGNLIDLAEGNDSPAGLTHHVDVHLKHFMVWLILRQNFYLTGTPLRHFIQST
mmetsp:Transcript_922/g.2151  ORF Transcript_922/g.2151 Transcript_922/m.2151 type:complete len:93 (-) Transcript_922:906-1184(-)